jgi:hypothetical protein
VGTHRRWPEIRESWPWVRPYRIAVRGVLQMIEHLFSIVNGQFYPILGLSHDVCGGKGFSPQWAADRQLVI